MIQALPLRSAFCYFRMGLVTGVVDKPELIAWADHQILLSNIPENSLIEISLAVHQPYSQLVRLLNSFQGEPDYDLPLKLLLARACQLLENDPTKARRLVQGLRLLNAEVYLPDQVRSPIQALDDDLQNHHQGMLSDDVLHRQLEAFLESYKGYIGELEQVAGGNP